MTGMPIDLSGKVAIVTGGSRGIGNAIGRLLAEAGARVALCARDGEQARAAAAALGRDMRGYACDVGAADQVETFVAAVERDLGRVDILVNNAGVTRDNLMFRIAEEDWDAVLDTNLKGAFLMTRQAARGMIKRRWGRVINITSVVGLYGNAGQANYAASKSGVIGLTKVLARELAKRKITVNAVAPGVVETVNRGGVHIVEPGLDIAVRSAVASGLLRASARLEPCDAFIIAVPTPFRDGHTPDLAFIDAAVQSLAPVLVEGNLVILESTVPVWTTRAMAGQFQRLRPDLRFPAPGSTGESVFVAHCPERVLPGNVMRDLIQNDRVVGGLSARSTERAVALYFAKTNQFRDL